MAALITPHHRSRFFPALAIALFLAVLAGFWNQYFGPLVTGAELTARVDFWAIHFHAAIFLTWMACFVAQAVLVHRGRVDLHRRVGVLLAIYGFAAAAAGIWFGYAIALRRMDEGMSLDVAASNMFRTLSDIGMFAGFLALGIVYRRRYEIHKRLMLLATLSLAFIGMGRLIVRLGTMQLVREQFWLFALLMLTPILIAMGHDLIRRRSVHPVYVIGLLLFLLRLLRNPFLESEAWRVVGRAMLRPFL